MFSKAATRPRLGIHQGGDPPKIITRLLKYGGNHVLRITDSNKLGATIRRPRLPSAVTGPPEDLTADEIVTS